MRDVMSGLSCVILGAVLATSAARADLIVSTGDPNGLMAAASRSGAGEIETALASVQDPEIRRPITEIGMVKSVENYSYTFHRQLDFRPLKRG